MDRTIEKSLIESNLKNVANKFIESIESSSLDSSEKERRKMVIREMLQARLDRLNKDI
jgi:hypothetical protein